MRGVAFEAHLNAAGNPPRTTVTNR